jgi:uncharacterized protein
LIAALENRFALDWNGDHGINHWHRVMYNGLSIAGCTGADVKVVRLFSLFHDSCRQCEGHDPGHGYKGGTLAKLMRGEYFTATDHQMYLLMAACAGHTVDLTHPDLTAQTCFDADRLDLGRVGIKCDNKYLSTEAARRMNVSK